MTDGTKLCVARPSDLTIGRRVVYRGSWGRGVMRDGEIVGGPALAEEEFVWDVKLDNDGGCTRWGYLDQFRIEQKPEVKAA